MLSPLHDTVRGVRSRNNVEGLPDLDRLKASELKAKKDHRQALNRWNDFVFGAEYKQKAAVLCAQSREYVNVALTACIAYSRLLGKSVDFVANSIFP